MLYHLDGHTPVPCPPAEWADAYSWGQGLPPEWIVGRWIYYALDEDPLRPIVTVSTVFLGLDHGLGGPVPLLFETMLFSEDYPDLDGLQLRWPTWETAEGGHMRTVRLARAVLDLPDEDREEEAHPPDKDETRRTP